MGRVSTIRNDAGAADVAAAAGTEAAARPALYTTPFVTLCAVALLCFGANTMLQPLLPILILQQGGDAALVGLVIAAFSLPSVVLRPLMGRAVDSWSQHRTLALGTFFLGIANLVYLVPSLAVVFLDRVIHGTAWAAFNTAGQSGVARLAPPSRRGEASGVYNLMPGIAQTLMPGFGLLLIGAAGLGSAFLLAALLSFAGAALVILGPLPRFPATARKGSGGFWSSLIERNALLPMSLEFLFTSVSALFLTFPPVWADAHGIPIEQLALYYPIYGLVLVVTRAVAGRFLDRIPRTTVIVAGACIAIAGLVLASTAQTVAMLTLAGSVYAFAAAFTSPTAMAMAIDRADPARMGAAMATYSLGFQMGLGVGAAVFGIVIQILGFPAPWLVAIGLQLLLIVALVLGARRRTPTTGGIAHGT
jgi:predicted MFS family arabinose efflux permease